MTDDREHGPEWLLEQAWRQVGRASTAEDRARALSTFRRAIATASKQGPAVTPELVQRLRQLEDEARRLYDEQSDQHVRKALRALGSLRMAIEAGLESRTPDDPVEVMVSVYGEEPATWFAAGREVYGFYGAPADVRAAGRTVFVQLNLVGTQPEVRVLDENGGVLWYRPASREFSAPRLLPHVDQGLLVEETGGNGHGSVNGVDKAP
jgi:hypothetical protein